MIRQRDCQAFIVDEKIKQQPVGGGEYHVEKVNLNQLLGEIKQRESEVSPGSYIDIFNYHLNSNL